MKLTFLGTRGYIDARTEAHCMHSSLLISYYHQRVKIDCGEDWLGQADSGNPHAILVTHAHPDHVGGLKEGAPCRVYATAEAWQDMARYPIEEKAAVKPRQPIEFGRLTCEAFEVVHSIISPAVGYRITGGAVTIFYAPDLVYIPEVNEALGGARLYIGDGATLTRSMVRRKDNQLFGHTPVRTQLTWCHKLGLPWMIVTHCGSEIVTGDPQPLQERLDEMAQERKVAAQFAYDGLELVMR